MTAEGTTLGRDAGLRSAVEVRELTTIEPMREAADLFAAVWETDAGHAPVSPDLLRALSHAGGYVAGAYDRDLLVGASVAFFGRPGVLHSHITGVVPEVTGRRVGLALKLHQRAWALERGVEEIGWTFDPLVRRNAYFNLAKLGVRVIDYLPDFYGDMYDGLNRGDPSDRLYVIWPIAEPRVAALAAGGPPDLADAQDRLTCPVPEDIVALRRERPDEAVHWRLRVRELFADAYRAGLSVVGVTSATEYVFDRVTT